MTELNLFSNQAPPAGGPDGTDPTTERRSHRQEVSAAPTTSPSGEPVRREPPSKRQPGRLGAPTALSTSATGASRRDDADSECLRARPEAPALPTGSPATISGRGELSSEHLSAQEAERSDRRDRPGRGELSSEHLLGLLDSLVGGLRGLGGGRLEECLRLVGRCEARLAAVRSEKVAELARWRGEAHAAGILRGDLKQSRGGAKREVQFAGRLADLPETAKALAAGDVTPQAARVIADAAAHTPVDEAELLGAAATQPADVFAHTVRDHVNERTAAEDLEARRRRQRARREANIKQQSDGMYKLFGTFDPVAGARIETALAAMANQLRHAEDPKGRATPAQRHADALEALITRHGPGAGVKAQRATLVVVADYDYAADQLADARLLDGTRLTPNELLKIALEADILPALFDSKGHPLWLGHKVRTASVAQRVALAIRDRGCVICGAANSYCQAHHVLFWEDGGPTDIDNLVLLCSDCHHKQIHELGAELTRHPDGTYTLEPPPNQPPAPARRNGKARRGRTRAGPTGPTGPGERGPPRRHSHQAGTERTVNQALQR